MLKQCLNDNSVDAFTIIMQWTRAQTNIMHAVPSINVQELHGRYNLEPFKLHFQSVKKYKLGTGHRGKVQSLAWSQSGHLLATGATDGGIRLWSYERLMLHFTATKDGKSKTDESSTSHAMELKGHSGSVMQLTWSPLSLPILASSSTDKKVCLWKVNSFQNDTFAKAELRSSRKSGKRDEKNQAALSNQIYPAVSIETGSENLNLSWHPSLPILVICTRDDRLIFIKLSKNFSKVELRAEHQLSTEINEAAWSPEGDKLLLGMASGQVTIFSLDATTLTVKELSAISGHTSNVFCVKWHHKNGKLAFGSSDASVTIWSVPEFRLQHTINRHEWPIRALSFSHDAQFLAIGSEDAFLSIEHVETGNLVAKIGNKRITDSFTNGNAAGSTGISINAVNWHPDKYVLAYAGDEVDDRTGRPTGSVYIFGL